ncbi:MAG: QueT transporter family protein [Clostridia bacterium]|nr:QueT transporter family protein [Clostridia bacterium]
MKNKTSFITQSALIAAVYVILTYITNMFGLANGAIQVRISEALTVLPYFTPAAVPGLFLGCAISNIVTGCTIADIVFGSIATLMGAAGTYLLRRYKYLAPLPPIIANVLIIPPVLMFAAGVEQRWLYLALTIGAGEVVSCGILGMALLKTLEKRASKLFR